MILAGAWPTGSSDTDLLAAVLAATIAHVARPVRAAAIEWAIVDATRAELRTFPMNLEQDLQDVCAWLSVEYPNPDLLLVSGPAGDGDGVLVVATREVGMFPDDPCDLPARDALRALGYRCRVGWGVDPYVTIVAAMLTAHERVAGWRRVKAALGAREPRS